MNVNNTNRSRLIVKAGLLVVVAAVQVMAAGTSRAKLSSAEKDLAVPTESLGHRDQRRLARVSSAAGKQKYVSGEVIVKLKDGQSSGISLFSGPYPTTVARDKTILLRLQTEYGLYSETSPVFKGVHKRLENQNTPQSSFVGVEAGIETGGPKPEPRVSRASIDTSIDNLKRNWLLVTSVIVNNQKL